MHLEIKVLWRDLTKVISILNNNVEVSNVHPRIIGPFYDSSLERDFPWIKHPLDLKSLE
jgi:hypothetical protein